MGGSDRDIPHWLRTSQGPIHSLGTRQQESRSKSTSSRRTGPPLGRPRLPEPGWQLVLDAVGDWWAWRQEGRQDRGPQSPLPQAQEAASALSGPGPLTEGADSERRLVPDAVSSHDPEFHPTPGGPKRRLRCSWL